MLRNLPNITTNEFQEFRIIFKHLKPISKKKKKINNNPYQILPKSLQSYFVGVRKRTNFHFWTSKGVNWFEPIESLPPNLKNAAAMDPVSSGEETMQRNLLCCRLAPSSNEEQEKVEEDVDHGRGLVVWFRRRRYCSGVRSPAKRSELTVSDRRVEVEGRRWWRVLWLVSFFYLFYFFLLWRHKNLLLFLQLYKILVITKIYIYLPNELCDIYSLHKRFYLDSRSSY